MNARHPPLSADLFAALGRLDGLLAAAVEQAEALAGSAVGDPDADPYRGLHVSAEDAQRLLERPPGAPTLWTAVAPALAAPPLSLPPVLARLARDHGLTDFDLDVILIALAPEVDLRYERLYGFLQDDVTRRHASVDLALNLLCDSASARLAARSRFAAEAPLLRHGLLHLHPHLNGAEPDAAPASLLSHRLALDGQLVQWLLCPGTLDRRLAACCRIVQPRLALDRLPVPAPTRQALLSLARQSRQRPVRLHFHGRPGSGRAAAAEALAQAISVTLLRCDLERAPDPIRALELALREARFREAVLLIEGLEALRDEHRGGLRRLLDDPAGLPGVTVCASSGSPNGSGSEGHSTATLAFPGFIDVAFGLPDVTERRACWLAELGPTAGASADLLAQRFRLGPGQIAAAAGRARDQARWRLATTAPTGGLDAADQEPGIAELLAAARAQTGQSLARLARKVASPYGWADLVLPAQARTQLEELCAQFTRRHVVYGTWGFERTLSRGKGLNCLFHGPPGTGKTMAAEVIANELQLDLYQIDLSRVVSKYIGETEKNLDRIFEAAEDANAILFFDEADALFGKRSETKDAHDRYANIEVGYLLQKMEEYAGVAILATNLESHLDDAFLRRLHVVVEFLLPDEAHRQRIWQGVFPREAPVGDDVDFARLARSVRMPGGHIRNIGLAAAFYAAGDGGVIRMPHIARAVQREHQKLGRPWNDWTESP